MNAGKLWCFMGLIAIVESECGTPMCPSFTRQTFSCVIITDCSFSNIHGDEDGGAISIDQISDTNPTSKITGSDFNDCSAKSSNPDGGIKKYGGALLYSGFSGTVDLKYCCGIHCSADQGGGFVVTSWTNSGISIQDLTLSQCIGMFDGGGLMLAYSASPVLARSNFTNCQAVEKGSDLFVFDGQISIGSPSCQFCILHSSVQGTSALALNRLDEMQCKACFFVDSRATCCIHTVRGPILLEDCMFRNCTTNLFRADDNALFTLIGVVIDLTKLPTQSQRTLYKNTASIQFRVVTITVGFWSSGKCPIVAYSSAVKPKTATPPFSKSKTFAKTKSFPKSKTFSESRAFPKSKPFSKSPTFTKTAYFSKSKALTKTKSFPKTILFSKSKTFWKSSLLSNSASFSQSLTALKPLSVDGVSSSSLTSFLKSALFSQQESFQDTFLSDLGSKSSQKSGEVAKDSSSVRLSPRSKTSIPFAESLFSHVTSRHSSTSTDHSFAGADLSPSLITSFQSIFNPTSSSRATKFDSTSLRTPTPSQPRSKAKSPTVIETKTKCTAKEQSNSLCSPAVFSSKESMSHMNFPISSTNSEMKSQIGKSESFLELSALETETNIWMTDLNETESVIIKKSEEIRSSSLSFKSLMEESIRAEQQTRIIKEPYIGYVVAIFLAFAVVAVGFVRLMFVEIQSKAHFEMPSKRMTSINPNKELKSNSVTVNDTKPVLNLPKAEEKCDEGHAGYEGDGEWYEEDGEWYEEDGEWYEEDGEWYVGEEAV